MDFLQSVLNNLPSILTALVSVVSIMAVHLQSRAQLKRNTAEKYMEMKFSVYSDFINAIAAFDNSPSQETLQGLISANCKAMMLSHPVHAEAFSNFCAVCVDIANKRPGDAGSISELDEEFRKARIILQFSLQCEMRDIDPSKHKVAKRILRKRKFRRFLQKLQHPFKKRNHNEAC